MKIGKKLIACMAIVTMMSGNVAAAGITSETETVRVRTPEGIYLDVNPFMYYYGYDIPFKAEYSYEEGYNSKNVLIEDSERYQFYEFPSGEHKGKRFCLKNGKLVTGLAVINGKTYCFAPDGFQVKSKWVTNNNGDKFYIGAKGVALTGWCKINGQQYYFKSNGVMVRGVVQINDKIYCFDSKGRRMYDKFYKSKWGDIYYIDKDGYVVTGWRKINGDYYYFEDNGQMVTGTYEIDGVWCEFDKNGKYIKKAANVVW